MGYDIHITRKDEWHDEHGEEIELEEWLAVVDLDPHLQPHEEMAATDSSAVVWIAEDGTEQMWFWMSEGNVMGKNPRPAALAKMYEISEKLNARLMGDEGEIYDAEGQASYPDFPEENMQKTEPKARPWWKFW